MHPPIGELVNAQVYPPYAFKLYIEPYIKITTNIY